MTTAESISKDRLRELVRGFAARKVLVVGDLILDEFVRCETSRISREAPVLIVDERGRDQFLGGAGNSVSNIRALGGEPWAVGIVGDDRAGERVRAILEAQGVSADHLLVTADSPTPTKTRVLAGGVHTTLQQILRIDNARPFAGTKAARTALEERLEAGLAAADAILVSDYSLGCVAPEVRERLGRDADTRPPLVADSRRDLLEFQGATVVTPNEEEVERALGVTIHGNRELVARAGQALLDRLGCRACLITQGKEGMSLFQEGAEPWSQPAFGATEVTDVTGAGDTVASVVTLALAAGADFPEAAFLANLAGGLVVMKRGTATITPGELLAAVDRA